MKKILLVAAIFAVASFNSFGASCSSLGSVAGSPTIAELATAGNCTVGASDQWTLDTWSLAIPSQTGYAAAPVAADVKVNFANLTSPGGGAGFSVTFSDSPTAGSFFNAVSGTTNQTASWKSLFVITGAAPIISVTSSVAGAQTGDVNNNGSIVLQKIITSAADAGNPTITDGTITTACVTGVACGTSQNPLALAGMGGNTKTKLGVIDNYQMNSGNAGSSALTSYTNTFYAADPTQTGVPEPMSFVLMGAGLVGIAALRRRNG